MKQHITIFVAIALIATMAVAAAENASSMWMEQNGNTIDLMVNTSETSYGANAWVHFDPECGNITNMSFEGSPWQPLVQPGWSHQADHVILALTNFSGVEPGQYKIAQMEVECVGSNCTSEINITKAEPIGVTVYNGTFVCEADEVQNDTVISIGICRGISSLPLVVENATNLGSCDITISWNPDVVRVSNIEGVDMDSMLANTEHIDEGWTRIGAIQTENPGISGNVTVASISFEAAGSGESTIGISNTLLKDATPDCNNINHTVRDGMYYSPIAGDLNGDGGVGLADVFYILSYCIGISGYETISDTADVNGDGIVDVSDAMYLAKHILGIPGYEELN